MSKETLTDEQLQGEKRGTHGGIIIMGVISLVSCAITDGGAGFYLTVGFFTVINAISFWYGT